MLSTLFMLNSISIANAADPQVLFEVDCVAADKALQVGFQSDPADPVNGPEIIAFGFTFELAPSGSTTINDLSTATLEVNPVHTNVVIAKNTSETVGNTQVIIVEGGFTGQQGLNDVDDLFFIKGTNQKPYTITVKDGELIPENSLDNIFVNTPEQSFNVDPSTCDEAAAAVGETSIEISADKSSAGGGEQVRLIATISNRGEESIDWIQTAGKQITPDIANVELENNQTESTLVFVMPGDTTDIKLKLTVGSVFEEVTIEAIGATPGAPAAPPLRQAAGTPQSISIQDFAFGPAELTIIPGTTVTWTNRDQAPHTVTTTGGAGPLDSGTIDPGGTFSFTFNDAGTFEYFCQIHPFMTARIIVQEGAAPPAQSLAERLAQRREEQEAQPAPAAPQPVFARAGADLAASGPAETGLLLLISLAVLCGWKALRKIA